MQQKRDAFTMIELVFVIVIIGILSAIAIPKFAVTRNDAVIVKAKTTVAALRSAISAERQKNILKGVFDDINASAAEGLLEYGLDSSWSRVNETFVFDGPGSTSCTFDVTGNRLVRDSSNCDVADMSDL